MQYYILFIRLPTLCEQGDLVEESKSSKIELRPSFLVSRGCPSSHFIKVYCDSTSVDAPIQLNDNVTELMQLGASLSSLMSLLPQVLGQDGLMYYSLHATIEAAYGSAPTQYTLIHEGRKPRVPEGIKLTERQGPPLQKPHR
jgi:hypothetical protein